MADETQLLYLEPDDEITTVVRRLREADAARVVLVASGRSKATSGAMALRLLAQVAAEEGRQLVLVADPGARALAAEAGIPAFASVADANAEGAVPLPAAPAQRAPIHVVRGEPEPAAPEVPTTGLGLEETQAVRTLSPLSGPRARPAGRVRGTAPARRARRVAIAAAVILALGLAGVAAAVVMPAATVTLVPQVRPVGPVDYTVELPLQGPEERRLEVEEGGSATGQHVDRIRATGVATFANYNFTGPVTVPAGTIASVDGAIHFATDADVEVPPARVVGLTVIPSEASVSVTAVRGGSRSNVAELAINRVEDQQLDGRLRGPLNAQDRRVFNGEPTRGGAIERAPAISQEDVDAVEAAIEAEMARQLDDLLAENPERTYLPGGRERPQIEVPEDLVGRVDPDGEGFSLVGTLDVSRPYFLTDELDAAAFQLLSDDPEAAPGQQVVADTIDVEIGEIEPGEASASVSVTVTAQAIPDIDEAALRGRIAGMTGEAARAELEPIGGVEVSLWPWWVDRVPTLEWRVRFDVRPAESAE